MKSDFYNMDEMIGKEKINPIEKELANNSEQAETDEGSANNYDTDPKLNPVNIVLRRMSLKIFATQLHFPGRTGSLS